MKIFSCTGRLSTLFFAIAACCSLTAGAQTHLVISQVYGGGGGTSSAATYNTDYIELYNPTASPISLAGLSLQYGSTTGSFASSAGNLKVFTTGTVQPGHYFLVTASSGSGGGTIPVTADDTSTLTISASAGKVALVNGTASLGRSTPCTGANIVDEVSFGTGNSCAEGTASPAASSTTAVSRNATGVDTDNNSVDFTAGTPTPRNTGSAAGTAAPPPVTPIATLQGNRSTYVGTTVSTTGVVTAVIRNGFFLQTASSTPGSSGVAEGLDVYTASRPTVSRGDNVTVTGSLVLFPSAAASHTPALELSSPTIATNSTGNSLPDPIVLPTGLPTAAGGIYQLTKYEGMRVMVPSLTAVSGTGGFLTESTETIVSSGEFYAVATGVARPFREPGIDFRDFPATTCPTLTNCTSTTTNAGVARPANAVLYDDNPERILVETSSAGGTAVDLVAGAVLKNVTGVMDFTYATDSPYGDPARFFLDAGSVSASNYTASPVTVTALPLPTAGQFTVAAFNVERFFNTTDADNFYYDTILKAPQKIAAANSVVVTADAYARRLKKVSLAIRTVLNNPDIISMEEVENGSVLRDIAAQIDADTTTGTKPGYIAFGTDNVTTYTNDIGGISVGFLINPARVNVVAVEQMGAQTTFTPTGATSAQTLNDRPSDVLHATIGRGTGNTPYPVTVISNHLRSLSGINTSANTRQKKELQAEMLATLIQNYQTNGEHVVAVGDLNAFQFPDGYTDTLGTITGQVGSGVAAQPGVAIVSPAATDLISTLPAAQQQTYTEFGNAQVLDHVVVSANIAASSTIAVGHINADFPLISYNDAATPARESDHDPVLAYLALPAPVTSAMLTGTAAFPATLTGSTSTGQVLTLTNTGESVITITGVAVTGDFSQSNTCGSSLAVAGTCAINVVFKPAVAGARTGSLAVSSSASVAALTLSGTALPPPDFSLLNSSGSATGSLTLAAGSTSGYPLTLASLNGFSGSVAVTCAASGTAPAGASCTVTSPVALAAAGSGSTVAVLSTTARSYSTALQGMPNAVHPVTLLLLALTSGVLVMLRRAGRKARTGGLLVLLMAVAMGLSGCSNSQTTTNPSGTPAGSYTYIVTAMSGGVTHTATINLTVQ